MKPAHYDYIQNNGNSKSRGSGYGKRARKHAERALVFFTGSVLDVGCNDGYAMEVFRDAGHPVTGVDINPERVEEAKGHGLHAFCCDVHELSWAMPLPWVDNVFCSHTLEHAYDPGKVILGICEATVRRIYIVVPKEKRMRHDREGAHYAYFGSVQDIMALVPEEWKLLHASEAVDEFCVAPDVEITAVLERRSG